MRYPPEEDAKCRYPGWTLTMTSDRITGSGFACDRPMAIKRDDQIAAVVALRGGSFPDTKMPADAKPVNDPGAALRD
jgi:hypothetical protein